MGIHIEPLVIAATEIEIESSCEKIPKGSGIEGGVVCTGFIDIEKILRRTHFHRGKQIITNFFLEKKLPFQVLLIAFEGLAIDGAHLDDWSGDSGSDETESGSDGSETSGGLSGSDDAESGGGQGGIDGAGLSDGHSGSEDAEISDGDSGSEDAESGGGQGGGEGAGTDGGQDGGVALTDTEGAAPGENNTAG